MSAFGLKCIDWHEFTTIMLFRCLQKGLDQVESKNWKIFMSAFGLKCNEWHEFTTTVLSRCLLKDLNQVGSEKIKHFHVRVWLEMYWLKWFYHDNALKVNLKEFGSSWKRKNEKFSCPRLAWNVLTDMNLQRLCSLGVFKRVWI